MARNCIEARRRLLDFLPVTPCVRHMASVVFVTLTEAFVANQRREAALYRRYHSFYGYAFYIGRKRADTDVR